MFDLLGIKVLGRKLKDKMISANADPSLDRVESAPPIDPPPPDEVPPEEADTEEEEEEEDVDEDEKRDELKELNSGGELGQLTRNGSSITGQEAEWARVFARLDEADGRPDGRIDRRALVKWVSALDLQKRIELESHLEFSPRELERLVSRADADKDGFVDKREFIQLVTDRNAELSKNQRGLLREYLKVAAYADRYSWWPPPIFIPAVTALQVAVYIYHVVHFVTHPDHTDVKITWTGPEPICSSLVYNPSRRRQAWRFISYCLVHAGIQHVLFNMVMQLFVGLPLEASHGTVRVAIVYLSGVLAGSLGSSTMDPEVFLAGASGGVYALIAAHLATLILNWREDIVIMRNRFRSGRAPAAKHGHIVRTMRLVIVLLYGALDTGTAMWHRRRARTAAANAGANLPLPSCKTSYAAHISGALAGLLVGIIVLKNRRVETWERVLKALCLCAFGFMVAAAILCHAVGDNFARAVRRDPTATYFPPPELFGGVDWEDDGTCHEYI